jgi:uncharacterized membrane protein YecN with MAPEG domain
MSAFLLSAAILVLLYAALSTNVSLMRLRKRKSPGITEAELTKAVRAHGNASEYIPLFVALFLYLHSIQAGPFLAGVAVVATLSRILHAAGMFLIASVTQRHPLRFLGALGTYICLFVFGAALLSRAL